MKNLLYIFAFFGALTLNAQDNLNLDDGFMAEGYDVVSYFNNSAKEGVNAYTKMHNGARYKFSSKTNLDIFITNPEKYVPQYGGFCAYAIAKDGSKVSVDPKTFLIQDGKLYLFYNAWFNNTLKKWTKDNPKEMQNNADKNWSKIN